MSTQSVDRQQIFEKVSKVLTGILNNKSSPSSKEISTLRLDTDIFTDLGLDSLESLDLLTGLEEEFDINPDQYEAADKRTIEQIVDYVIELKK